MRIGIKTKHQISNECGFLPATDVFFDLLVAKSKGYYCDTILTLTSFNKTIGKTRKKGSYAKSHLVSIRNQLLECHVIKVKEKLGTWSYRVAIVPFDQVQNSEESAKKMNADTDVVEVGNADSETDTEVVAEDSGLRQQQLVYANQKARSLRIDFGVPGLKQIAEYPREILDKVFVHYQFAREHNHIASPTGWIIRNLERKWHLNFRPEAMVKSVTDKYFELQDLLIEEFGTVPSRVEQFNSFTQKKATPRTT